MQIPHRWKADYSKFEQYAERRNRIIALAPTKVETPSPTQLIFSLFMERKTKPFVKKNNKTEPYWCFN